MKSGLKKLQTLFGALALAVLAAGFVSAQQQEDKGVRLRSGGAAVRGFIGGESHNKYYVRARKGQTITVTIARRVKKDGNFNLTVSRSGDFMDAEPLGYGKETSGRRQLVWTGKARATGNYYFYTTAYPPTRYTIRVSVR